MFTIQDDVRGDDATDDSIRVALARDMDAIGTFMFDLCTLQLEWSQPFWKPQGVDGGAVSLAELKAGMLGSATPGILELCRTAIDDGSDHVEFELPVHGRKLGRRNLRLKARLVRNAQGEVQRFIGVMQDVTEADIRERALRARETELGAILATVSDAMIVVDGEGAIGAFSRAAQDLLGYDSAAMIGRSIAPLVEGGWPEVVAAADHGPRELRMIGATGYRLPVELRTGSLAGDGRAGYILFLTDITERRAQEARRKLFEHTARDIAMAEFAVQLRHELNQPLAAASNFLAVAQRLAADPARAAPGVSAGAGAGEMIDLALNQIDRIGGIIRSSQRKVMGEDMDPQLVDVRAAIDAAVVLVRMAHGHGGVEFAVRVDPDAAAMFVDPVGIQQVLANLLRNAIEAFGRTPRAGACIAIRSQRADRRLLLSVADNGPGIPTAALADLFEPFRHREKKSGMGLGLSICRTIAEAHGGTLSAENLARSGACFTLALPSHERDEPA